VVLLHAVAGGQRAHRAPEKLGVVCYGKVYRKDEIDRKHMNIFHQFGGWYMTPADTDPLTIDNLRNALAQIVRVAVRRKT
jgi:phenylalanyl-tRNA synthetase alpha subunit